MSGRSLVEQYFRLHVGHAGMAAARRQFDAWLAEALFAKWMAPTDIRGKYASASIVAGNRVVFNISGNRFRLIVKVNYPFGVVDIRFFGTHAEYDNIDARTV